MLIVVEQFDGWFDENFEAFYANKGLRKKFVNEKSLIKERCNRDRSEPIISRE